MMKPKPPRTMKPVDGHAPIAVTPTDEVVWSDEYDTWIVHYTTDDERVPSEFRSWRAVWTDGGWDYAEA